MISVADALAHVLAGVSLVGTETVPLPAGLGRVLSENLLARVTQPAHDLSAMDGYALGEGIAWSVIGAAPAGHPFDGTLQTGQALRVYTGSVVPPGTVRVAAQEGATLAGDRLTVLASASPHIRRAGQDFGLGDVLVPVGVRLGPRAIGLAAAGNHPWLTVRRRPRVAILATGDEVALPGAPIPPGGIVSSNAHAIAALVHVSGGEPCILPIATDRVESVVTAMTGTGADLLVTCGGASVGDFDVVREALRVVGFRESFWQVAMRPGKPLLFGHAGLMPVLGLPGNPVSAFVCSVLFLRPAIAAMLGQATETPFIPCRLTAAMAANDQRQDYVRATRHGQDVTPLSRQDSSLLSVLARAEALIVRAPNAAAAAIGDVVLTIDLDST